MKIGKDKKIHFGVCAVIAAVLAWACSNVAPIVDSCAIGAMTSWVIGFAKEWYDFKREDTHSSDPHDYVADFFGGSVGAIIIGILLYII